MARYRLEISATAECQLKRLPRRDLGRVVDAIQALAAQPCPPGSRQLSGYDDVYRIRVGPYRVLYSVDGRRIVVVILKVGHRRDVYR